MTVVAEITVFDKDVAVRVGAGQDAVFIVVDEGVAQGEIGAFQAESRAVLVGYLGAQSLDVVDRNVIAAHDTSALAERVAASRIYARTAVHATDGEVVPINAANIAAIGRVAGDLERVAVLSCREGGAGS